MEVLILGICHEIFFFGKKRSKIRVRIMHRRALYTGKYGSYGNLVFGHHNNFLCNKFEYSSTCLLDNV